MKRKRWATIRVQIDVKGRLESMRKDLGAKSLNEVIKILVNEYEKSIRSKVKSFMCNDMGETSASYVGWVKILLSRGLKPNEVALALKFLNGSIDELRVDKTRCID